MHIYCISDESKETLHLGSKRWDTNLGLLACSQVHLSTNHLLC